MKVTNTTVNSDMGQVRWTSGKSYSPDDIITWLQYRKSHLNTDEISTEQTMTLQNHSKKSMYVAVNCNSKDNFP